ncbi:MAG: DUF1353 domain-containing protein [Rhodoferax sp.]|nr:DUF1353 domain-containing protein [Rhodoferax sp.]
MLLKKIRSFLSHDPILSRIQNKRTLRKIPGTDRWVVQEAFVWYIDYENKERAIIVPAGFGTDFGSIPRILHPILSPTKYIAYILHDYLYAF